VNNTIVLPDAGVDREKVLQLEREIQKLPQVDCPVRHYFAPGMAAREMTIPAGVVITGAVHRHEHLCTVSKGRLLVSTDDGMREIAAPYTFTSKAGSKRVGYALEETVWTTYHATDTTDIDKLIEEITESTNAELLGGSDNAQLRNARIAADREDYQRFLAEYGLSQDVVTRLVENEADQVPMPEGFDSLELRASDIAGKGMFATRDIEPGERISPVRIDGKRTPAGRFINHSAQPNTVFVLLENGDLVLEAKERIAAGAEITNCYRQAMSVNGSGFKPIGEHA
jgi:hypothetical protein